MTEEKDRNEIGWKFDTSYLLLPKRFYTIQKPTKVSSPEIVILNQTLAKNLGLNIEALQNKDGVAALAGNQIPDGSLPLAQAYAGHQFGYFTMLGDGRALLLGEHIMKDGKRIDIQLKGSGRTPYSRGGDGRAALGPMLREYLISEAMFALGIPTTRSLTVVTTGEFVMRESNLPGAILTRIADSHIRVATFQYIANWGEVGELKALADYTLRRHFPGSEADSNCYLNLLHEVIKRQAALIAKWQLVGFIHGVMNTDNMSICGETIDYGPCAFMDTYDPDTVFSSIDTKGRYAYGRQPDIAAWNLARFAETLLPLLHEDTKQAISLAEELLSSFFSYYQDYWLHGMRAKLGIFNDELQDELLIEELLNIMKQYEADYTNTFLALTFEQSPDSSLFHSKEFKKWKERWQDRLSRQKESKEASHQLMRDNNPAVIPRNHRVEEALTAAVDHGDYTVMRQLMEVLSKPYAHSPEQAEFAVLPEKKDCSYRTFCGT